MKTLKKLLAASCTAAFVLASCQEESFEGRPETDNYYASVETFSSDTRTALQEGSKVIWSEEDRIAIFEGNDIGHAYQVLEPYVGKSSAEFAPVEGLMTGGAGKEFDGTVAVYPFDESITVAAGAEGTYTISGIEFPSEQHHATGTFSEESFPMAGLSASGSRNLSFKNIGGVVKLSLTGSYSVSQITLTGHSGEILSGPATVTLGPDGIPSVTMSDDASTSVSLICDPAVQLDPEEATDFYISIPPTQFKVGFKVTILDEDGKEHGVATHKDNSVKRSTILAMPETTPENLDDIELTADMFCSVDFIEGWTETRFGGDGTMVFVKEDEQGRMTHTLMFLPDEENILMPVYIRYDENEIPSYMSFMDTEIYIDGYTENTVDFTLAVEDAVWSIKDVPCNELMPYSLQTRAWTDNNAIRNACAIGNLIVGVAGVAGGVVMISASGIGAALTGGASVPVSVAGIALGVMNIKGGCDAIVDSFETIFGPAEQEQSTYVKDGLMGIGMEKVSDAIQNAPKKDFIKKILPAAILKDPADLGKMGTISYWSGFIFSSIDEGWGETYTGHATLAEVHQEVQVVTGRADNITTDSAELYGYVSPLATAPFGDRILTEIYIVLWKAGDENNKQNRSIFNSDGGTVSFTFINLESDTEYYYQTIFEDLENKIYRFGEVNTFKTKGDEDGRWVDLGLSVLWAAYNVGASSPEEYGGYYAWGETEEKESYTRENYTHRVYNHYTSQWYGGSIGKEISSTTYDVAHVTWGGGARMPTQTEVEELANKCTFTDGSYKGVSGSYVTGPNGNSIFLPFAGYRDYDDLRYEGNNGSFWSGTLYDDYEDKVFDYDIWDYIPLGTYSSAYFLDCEEDYGNCNSFSYGRYHGRSVRPVKEK